MNHDTWVQNFQLTLKKVGFALEELYLVRCRFQLIISVLLKMILLRQIESTW